MTWLTWLLLIPAGYGLIVAGMYGFQRRFQYFPSHFAQDAETVTGGLMRTARYRTSDSLDLTGWYFPPAPGRPTLVWFHGNGGQHGDRAPLTTAYMNEGYGVLIAGYRGYGTHPGSPSEQGLYADARAALEWLSAQGTTTDSIVIYGESLGTGVAVQMATEFPPRGLVLQAPFTSAVDVARAAYPWLPVGRLMHDRFDSLSKITRVRTPLLLIHGEQDAVIDVKLARRLFAAANEPKTAHFVPQATHNDLDAYGISEPVLAFLDSLE